MVNSSSNAVLNISADSWEEYRRLQNEANAICSAVQKTQIESDTKILQRIALQKKSIPVTTLESFQLPKVSDRLKQDRDISLGALLGLE